MYSLIPMVISFRKAGHCLPLMGLAILLGLTACTTPPTKVSPQAPSSELAQAKALAAEGRYRAAAAAYTQLAASAQSPQRQDYQLHAAAALLQGNYQQEANMLLDSITLEDLESPLKLRYHLLAAQLAIAEGEVKRALLLLEGIETLGPSLEQQAALHRLRAQAYELEDNLLAAARERVQLEPLLSNAQALQENQLALWGLLMKLTPDILATLPKESISPVFDGWLKLAQLFQRYPLGSPGLQQAIEDWRARYPGHPASLPLLQAEMATLPTMAYRPSIALLLPTEGPFAASAKAVQNGFFAAYYDDNSGWASNIRFYEVTIDSDTGHSNVDSIYQQAQAEGASFVVGPLVKQSLAQLAATGDLLLPTLALNYLDKSHGTVENLYQFTLSPEDEAREVAERAWHDGHRNALALIPDTQWGQRVEDAFAERWESLGGTLVGFQAYDPEQEDYSLLIQRLLNINEKQSRQQVRQEFTLEPQRHHEADFIFLAAFPRQARLLVPQLQFHQAKELPVYSSSHIYSGYPDPENDLDLNGVLFCDIPWVLDKNAHDDPSYQSLATAYPKNFEQLKRFYALGVDAYRIIPHLKILQQSQDMTFDGATGTLQMDTGRHLRRALDWAQFKKGQPQPVAK
ncbi:penicillin-binding protein activator [Nitrosococcus watsonii]|uniref:LppC family lipoprotein n=1 Tax=Nitrosococcus watsoni (strain C-113) TaxID=105559 RepID=D8KAT6_NITWC|nr:penicillin-binding protein activator [Nitrosococcus watsonii]ADJ29513.1 LppC family lipoprotein [Nitrosococcus watsonii C-113]